MNDNDEENMRVKYRVKRLTYTQRDFDNEFQEKPKPPFTFSRLKSKLRKVRLRTFGFELFPIFKSLLSYYNLRYFLLDVISGVTMAFFHLPQGNIFDMCIHSYERYGLWNSCRFAPC